MSCGVVPVLAVCINLSAEPIFEVGSVTAFDTSSIGVDLAKRITVASSTTNNPRDREGIENMSASAGSDNRMSSGA